MSETGFTQYKPGDQIGGAYSVAKVFGGNRKSGMGIVYLARSRNDPFPVIF